jgi:methionyl-tRNA synthetase
MPAAIEKMELEVQEKARQATCSRYCPNLRAGPRCRPATKITIDDFAKVEMRVGQVLSAERVKGADKLLHMKVDIGEASPRSIVAGHRRRLTLPSSRWWAAKW